MDLTEAIDQYSLSEYGHTDWGWIYAIDREELAMRSHHKEGYVVFFDTPDADHT